VTKTNFTNENITKMLDM